MIKLTWADAEKTLLLWQFDQRWTRIDFMNACQQSLQMVKTNSHSVNVIIDLSLSQYHPSNLVYLSLMGMRMREENTGAIIVISPSQLWLRLYIYIQRAYPKDTLPIKFASSFQNAVQGLQSSISTKCKQLNTCG